MKKLLIAAIVSLGLLFSAGSTATAQPTSTPWARAGCATPHHAAGQHSLKYIAWHQTHGDVAYLLTATLRCNGGTRFPAFLQAYLDQANLKLPVYKGTRLWFKAPGIGQPLAKTSQ